MIAMKVTSLRAFVMVLVVHSIMALNLNPTTPTHYETPLTHSSLGRRTFLGISVVTLTGGASGGLLSISPATAASGNSVTQTIKVTPVSRTFVTSMKSSEKAPSIKPLRENDATRFFTNARVVHTFYGGDDSMAVESMKNILDLTMKRKIGKGAGVTPGEVHLLSDLSGTFSIDGLSNLNSSDADLKEVLAKLPSGDVVFLPPTKSGGTIANAKIVEETGARCGLDLGGEKGGGVISILLNGPRNSEAVVVSDGGYLTSTILWYDI